VRFDAGFGPTIPRDLFQSIIFARLPNMCNQVDPDVITDLEPIEVFFEKRLRDGIKWDLLLVLVLTKGWRAQQSRLQARALSTARTKTLFRNCSQPTDNGPLWCSRSDCCCIHQRIPSFLVDPYCSTTMDQLLLANDDGSDSSTIRLHASSPDPRHIILITQRRRFRRPYLGYHHSSVALC
jgi:hypothetical protein